MDEALANVLAAREERWLRRLSLARDRQACLVTITLCLPVAYRTRPDYGGIFARLCDRFQEMLVLAGFAYRDEGTLEGADGPARLLTIRMNADLETATEAATVKRFCVQAEDRLAGGRMLDIDVMDRDGNPIGRSDIGLPPRKCFVCDGPAAVCVSRKRHVREEIDRQVAGLTAEAGGLPDASGTPDASIHQDASGRGD